MDKMHSDSVFEANEMDNSSACMQIKEVQAEPEIKGPKKKKNLGRKRAKTVMGGASPIKGSVRYDK